MKSGAAFESFVAYVYSNLLRLSDCNSVVSNNISIKGLSGCIHEFDVYYEFYHLNMLFRVAIECKDWDHPVDKGRVQEFWAKIDDLNNVAGVMVAKNGYQLGALQFAQAKGIMLLTLDDLPSLTQIVAEKIRRLFLPDAGTIRQPFWTLMERYENNVNGNYYDLHFDGHVQIPLFFCKNIAESFLKRLPDEKKWCVRGIAQPQLKALVNLSQTLSHYKFALCMLPTDRGTEVEFCIIGADELKRNYCFE